MPYPHKARCDPVGYQNQETGDVAVMNADQLRGRAQFYRSRAIIAERDEDFELLFDFARIFDSIAQDTGHAERHLRSEDINCRERQARGRLRSGGTSR
jgi:hypothetical protein